jgi:hypothetical protein
MTKRIEVPGVGVVEFPDSMSDEQITNAIRTNIMPKYSAKAETPLQTFGRSAASIPDTALNLITGTLDMAAYPLARAYYGMTGNRTPEQAAALAQQQTTSPKDVIGRALGVAGTPGYENAPQRQLGNYIGQTIGEGVVNPLAETTGMPAQDVGSMINIGTLAAGPAIPKALPTIKAPFKAAGDIASGAVGRATGYIAEPSVAPVGYQVPSSRAKLRDTVMLPEDVAKFEQGKMPYGQMPTEVPIQQLPRNAVERTALKMSGGEIPYQGQAARAFGERIGETYQNPVTAAIDIGSMFATGGIPILTAARTGLAGVRGMSDYVLSRRGLDPNLPTRMAEYQSGARPMPGTPPAPGPVNPANMPPPAPPAPPAPSAGPTPQQMAIQKTQEIVSGQTTPVAPTPSNVDVAQLRAKLNQSNQTSPVETTPTTSGGSLFDPVNFNKLTTEQKLQALRNKAKENPSAPMTKAEEKSAQSQMTKQGAESIKSTNNEIISDFAKTGTSEKVDMISGTTPLERLTNESNATKGMADYLAKNGVDSIPTLEGMSSAQIIHAIFKEMTGKGGPSKKGPSNVSRMMTGEGKFNAGTYDNPISHTDAMKTLEWANLTEPEKLNIVGKSIDNSEKYIIRRFPNRNETVYEYTNPKTGKMELEIEKEAYKGGIADGDVRTNIKDHSGGFNYVFSNGNLVQIQNVSTGKNYSPNMPEFSKYKIDYIDPMDAIKRIKK